MKKQFQLLMCTGIMAAAVMASCKTADSVVLYDADARPNKVYRATNTTGSGTNTKYTRIAQKSGEDIMSNTNVVISNNQSQTAPSCPYNNAPTGQYMPQVIDMTAQNNVQPAYYNQQVQPVTQNYGTYNSVQGYNTRRVQTAYQPTTGRNKALDNNLYNRPTAHTLSEDMYTPEYRAMVNTRHNRGGYVQSAQNDPYAGLMTIENGNVVPYEAQPREVVVQHQYYGQPEYVQPQQYVVPAEKTKRQCCAESQNEVKQADGSYPATLFFKNGAKLTGTLVKIDNSACMFKMAEGRLVNFATKDILRIEKR